MSENLTYMNTTEIQWTFKSARVQHGIQSCVDQALGEAFAKYVTVAMKREISRFGAKSAVVKERVVTAKMFTPTQKTGLKGDRLTTGEKEQWLLYYCAPWTRQLAATDEAFASLEKCGMLASEFAPIKGSALGSHLAFLRDNFLAERQPKPTGTLEVVKP
jgi:hypothetical protein